MRKLFLGTSACLLATMIAPAHAQEEVSDGFSVSGSAAIVSDYRFRGLSQNGEEAAIQGGATISHDSGFYVGFWGSSVDFSSTNKDGSPSNQSSEIDAIVGYSTEVSPGLTIDGGVTYYMYPGGTNAATDYFEPYLSLSGAVGPVTAKVGAAYMIDGQNALGGKDNIYVYTDLAAAIPNTPLTLKGHYGYSDGIYGAGGNYADYSIGAEASWKALTFGVSYINTTGYGNQAVKEAAGADGTVLFSVTAAF
ncbi:MAG: hypothetical protein E2598_10135 [Sphingobium sp.]|nr:hypothetical protein [Sphingobium sp.]